MLSTKGALRLRTYSYRASVLRLMVCSHCPTSRPVQRRTKNGLRRIVWRYRDRHQHRFLLGFVLCVNLLVSASAEQCKHTIRFWVELSKVYLFLLWVADFSERDESGHVSRSFL